MAQGPLPLSLKRAVEIASSPEGNTNTQLSGEALEQARLRSLASRAALLPDFSASIGERNQTINLAAMGIRFNNLPIPRMVGPFTTMDARVTGTQTVFDFASLRRFQASKSGIAAAKSDTANISEAVAGQVARAYLAAVKGDA